MARAPLSELAYHEVPAGLGIGYCTVTRASPRPSG
jgi:hypothetical protein